MSKVVGLKGQEITEKGVPQDVLEILRDLLSQAERGEITNIAAVFSRPNGVFDFKWSCASDRHLMVAGTAYLQYELVKD